MEEQLQKTFNNVSLSINADKQTIDLALLPRGEDRPISFHICYKLQDNGEKTEFIIQNATSDRLWVDEFIKIWLEKNNFQYKIPQNIAGFVKMFMRGKNK